MCLIAFSFQQHPQYPLIVMANRDEFYERPTEQAHWWKEHPALLAGRDTQAGGSWMGIGKNGRFAALTNYREPQHIKSDAPTRGLLVTDFITGKNNPGAYMQQIYDKGQAYNGFNLLTGTASELWWYSNRGEEPLALQPGLYGVSNALLNTPWPKLERVKSKLSLLTQSITFDHQAALDALIDKEIFPDPKLPQTGVPLEIERMLSAMYIQSPKYGTRCSTVITIDRAGTIQFTERSFVPDRGTVTEKWKVITDF